MFVFVCNAVSSRHKGRTIIFLEGGGGMKNIEKNCLQGLKRQNKLFANIICITKIVCIEVRETCYNLSMKKKLSKMKVCRPNVYRLKV